MTNNSSHPLYNLRYPIGQFKLPDSITKEHVSQWIATLELFPEKLKSIVSELSVEQLDTAYRPGGWTIRQVVHHLADSHTHSYIRFKWALTEDKPVIKYYYEDRWAELPDAKTGPIEPSLMQLSAVHHKLVSLLKSLSEDELDQQFIHPEYKKSISLRENAGIYAWHCDHHFAHIHNCLKENNWLKA